MDWAGAGGRSCAAQRPKRLIAAAAERGQELKPAVETSSS